MNPKRDPSSLTREDRETLRLIQSSRRQKTAETALKQAVTRLLLDLGSKLNSTEKPAGEQ